MLFLAALNVLFLRVMVAAMTFALKWVVPARVIQAINFSVNAAFVFLTKLAVIVSVGFTLYIFFLTQIARR